MRRWWSELMTAVWDRLDPCQDEPVDLVQENPANDVDALIPQERGVRADGNPLDELDRAQRTRLAALQAVSRTLVGDDVGAGDLIDAAAYVVTGERVPPPPEHVYRAVREREGY